MENLKTLSQINMPSDGCCCEDNIRLEAIKWIKELLKKHPELRLYPYDLQYSITWIKHFFNISDEELQ